VIRLGLRNPRKEERKLSWGREGNRESSYEKNSGKFLRITSELEKVFARILDEFFRSFDLPKINVYKQFKFHDLDLSPYILKLRIISFSSKKCS
jgi:hypothetical protein